MTHAEQFLDNWHAEYEETMGEKCEPSFDSCRCFYSEIKSIPHQLFDDGSVVVNYRDCTGKLHYVALCSASELDNEWDMAWTCHGHSYLMQPLF